MTQSSLNRRVQNTCIPLRESVGSYALMSAEMELAGSTSRLTLIERFRKLAIRQINIPEANNQCWFWKTTYKKHLQCSKTRIHNRTRWLTEMKNLTDTRFQVSLQIAFFCKRSYRFCRTTTPAFLVIAPRLLKLEVAGAIEYDGYILKL